MKTECGFRDNNTWSGADALAHFGPTLIVRIGFDQTFYGEGRTGHPNLPEKTWEALIDTGAGESCIDNDLALQLHLPVVDRVPISGVHGLSTANRYLAQIIVPSLHNFTIIGSFTGANLTAGGQRHHALIGRSFLRHFRLVYDGTSGQVSLEKPEYHPPDVTAIK